MKVWCYVLATDNGTAPNYDPPCLTLGLCKPKIRQSAQAGDLVIAFAGRSLHPNPDAVIWAAVVTETLEFAAYWHAPRFQAKKGRPPAVLDNIYEPHPGEPDGFRQHPHAYHDAGSKDRDVSGRNVLIFGGQDTWIFRSAPRVLPKSFGLCMGAARRGHQTSYLDDRGWAALRGWFSSTPAEAFGAAPVARPLETTRRPRRC